MIKCSHCGKTIADDVRFCPACGREQTEKPVQEVPAQPPAPVQPYVYPPAPATAEETSPGYTAASVQQQPGVPLGGGAYLGGTPVPVEPPVITVFLIFNICAVIFFFILAISCSC